MPPGAFTPGGTSTALHRKEKMKIISILIKYSEGERLGMSEAWRLLAVEKDSVAFYWLLETVGRKASGNLMWDKIIAVAKMTAS